ncbi:DUF2993 domain-containing protein [Corynebacterium sp. Q4381]|uniref:LmeA family phospholipid-binding protein n=1 Tax=Corynebacterium sp. Marseille-Q4381 TaxID=3121597 RepID=UPI002FE60D7A
MKTAWKVIVGILAALLVLLIVAEIGVRMFLTNQITKGVEQQSAGQAVAAGQPEVSFGSQPVTLGLLTGSLPHLTVTTPSTLTVSGDTISGEPGATIKMDKVNIVDGEPVAQAFTLTTELPNDFLRATLNQSLHEQLGDNRWLDSLITVSEVTTDPANGTFTVLFTSGVAGIELRPAQTGGGVSFEAESTQLFGFNLPSEVAGVINNSLEEGMASFGNSQMHLSDVAVTPDGLQMQLSGENVNFNELQQSLVPSPQGTQQQEKPAYAG